MGQPLCYHVAQTRPMNASEKGNTKYILSRHVPNMRITGGLQINQAKSTDKKQFTFESKTRSGIQTGRATNEAYHFA